MSTCGWLGPDWSACGVCPLLRSPAALSFLFFLCAPTAEYDDDDSQGDDGEGVEEEEEEEDFSSEEEESDDESDSSMERYRRRGY